MGLAFPAILTVHQHTPEKPMETKIGAVAPDFTLAAHNTDQKISLANYRGRLVVVAFMPFAFTGG